MDPTARGITIPFTPQEAGVLLAAFAVAALSAFFYWLRRRSASERTREESRTVRAFNALAILLAPVWAALIVLDLRYVWMHFQTPPAGSAGDDLRWYFLAFVGLVTALGALVSAPIALIRVHATERQTRVAEQGHVTDQINKAVAGLGSAKEAKRQRRNKVGAHLYEDGPDGKPDFKKPIFEVVTVPNIEVRVGAIYALERIAQDSMKHDRGRDHVQIMEILCAYVRENAPAGETDDFPEPEWKSLKSGATKEERAAHEEMRRKRFGDRFFDSKAWIWARSLKARTEIQAAVQVIGRRTPEQVAHERADRRYGWRGFRLDLRGSDLRAVDASGTRLGGARLDGARLEGADLGGAQLEGARLEGARLEGANLWGAQLEGADLREARLEGAYLRGAQLERADLREARLEGAYLREARLDGADLREARLDGAYLPEARLKGANLQESRLDGAYLQEVRLDKSTDLTAATLRGAAVKSVNCTTLSFSQEQVDSLFADGTVTLPERLARPAHWPAAKLDGPDFRSEWRKWQASPETYVPPDAAP